jgi:GGDEF domain-containing protein
MELLISERIGRSLSLPLRQVSEVTRKIRDTEDFDHRLPSTHVSEVHALPISCTASIGIGLYPKDGQSTNELMARVDSAMYEAKSRGRDQIRFVKDVVNVEPHDQVKNEE